VVGRLRNLLARQSNNRNHLKYEAWRLKIEMAQIKGCGGRSDERDLIQKPTFYADITTGNKVENGGKRRRCSPTAENANRPRTVHGAGQKLAANLCRIYWASTTAGP